VNRGEGGAGRPSEEPAEHANTEEASSQAVIAALVRRLSSLTELSTRIDVKIEWVEFQLRDVRSARSDLDERIGMMEKEIAELRAHRSQLQSLLAAPYVGAPSGEATTSPDSLFGSAIAPEMKLLQERRSTGTEEEP